MNSPLWFKCIPIISHFARLSCHFFLFISLQGQQKNWSGSCGASDLYILSFCLSLFWFIGVQLRQKVTQTPEQLPLWKEQNGCSRKMSCQSSSTTAKLDSCCSHTLPFTQLLKLSNADLDLDYHGNNFKASKRSCQWKKKTKTNLTKPIFHSGYMQQSKVQTEILLFTL